MLPTALLLGNACFHAKESTECPGLREFLNCVHDAYAWAFGRGDTGSREEMLDGFLGIGGCAGTMDKICVRSWMRLQSDHVNDDTSRQ